MKLFFLAMASWPGRVFLGAVVACMVLWMTGLPVAMAQSTDPVLEYVPNISNTVELDFSGDGRWAVWTLSGAPRLFIRDLKTGTQSVIDLRTALDNPSLDLPNDVPISISDDGSRIALFVAISGSSRQNDLLLVLDQGGNELVRAIAFDIYNAEAVFDDFLFIDGTGRYVTFSVDARTLRSYLPDGTRTNHFESGEVGNVFRMEVTTGALERVSADTSGNELNNGSAVKGISDAGQFIVYQTPDSYVPGVKYQIYLRDMNLSGGDATQQVSIDPTGVALAEYTPCGYFCRNVGISDNGEIVALGGTTAGGEDGVLVWRRDGVKEFLTQFDNQSQLGLSGNGLWLTTEGETFIRYELATGNEEDSPTNNSYYTRISDTGSEVLFQNRDLAIPDGNFGNWWTMSFPSSDTNPPSWPNAELFADLQAPDSVRLAWTAATDISGVDAYIVYRNGEEIVRTAQTLLIDGPLNLGIYDYRVEAIDVFGNISTDGPTASLNFTHPIIEVVVNESVSVVDNVSPLLSVQVTVYEPVSAVDSIAATQGILVDVHEAVLVGDGLSADPSRFTAVHEAVTVSNLVDVAVAPPPKGISLVVKDLLAPGAIFTALAEGFKAGSLVRAFLLSEPVLVGEAYADGSGQVAIQITVPLDFPSGRHTLALEGIGADGGPLRLTLPVEVESSPLDIPANLNATDGTYPDKVRVTWDDVAGEDSYYAYRCLTANTDSCTLIASPAADSTIYDDTGANADGTVYYYRVRACSDDNGCGGMSNPDGGNRAATNLIFTDSFEGEL